MIKGSLLTSLPIITHFGRNFCPKTGPKIHVLGVGVRKMFDVEVGSPYEINPRLTQKRWRYYKKCVLQSCARKKI